MRILLISLIMQFVGVLNTPTVDQIYQKMKGSSIGLATTSPEWGDVCFLGPRKGIAFEDRKDGTWFVWFPGDAKIKSIIEVHKKEELIFTKPDYLK